MTVVVTLDATSDDTGAVATGAGKGAGGTAITIKNFRYSPDPIVVTAGDTITVTGLGGGRGPRARRAHGAASTATSSTLNT